VGRAGSFGFFGFCGGFGIRRIWVESMAL